MVLIIVILIIGVAFLIYYNTDKETVKEDLKTVKENIKIESLRERLDVANVFESCKSMTKVIMMQYDLVHKQDSSLSKAAILNAIYENRILQNKKLGIDENNLLEKLKESIFLNLSKMDMQVFIFLIALVEDKTNTAYKSEYGCKAMIETIREEIKKIDASFIKFDIDRCVGWGISYMEQIEMY